MTVSIILGLLLYGALPTMASLEEAEWTNFKVIHNKAYADAEEEARRFQIFRDNLKTIQRNNELFEKGGVRYKLGVNKFADISQDEFGASIKANAAKWNFKLEDRNIAKSEIVEDDGGVPVAMDWRERGAVTSVKDETFCYNSYSWAFSVAAAMETQYFLASGTLESLSSQQLIECTNPADNIDPWYQNFAFSYLKRNPVATEDNYPYTCSVDACKSQDSDVRLTLNSAKDLVGEQSIQNHCGTNGTVSVYIDASRIAHYQSGVIDGTLCSNDRGDLNHAVLVVGYGEEEEGGKYWILKNSWGVNWGEDGYFRIARLANNTCGIAWSAVIPIVYK